MDNKRKIATLFDSNRQDDSQDRQAFYAGGSDHSGQQILGPPNEPGSSELIENVFTEAQRIAQRDGESTDEVSSLPIRFWRNGFTIGDKELRPYDTPKNQQFLDLITRGETPPELVKLMQGGMVQVKLESRRHEDYQAQPRKVVAFSGEGHSPAPGTVGECSPSTPDTTAPTVVGVEPPKPMKNSYLNATPAIAKRRQVTRNLVANSPTDHIFSPCTRRILKKK